MRKITSLFIALCCLCTTAVRAQPGDLGDPLITSADQLSSPFSDSEEGKDIGALCDFDPGTFWHSDWHNTITENHYLQIELPSMMSGDFVLWIKRRVTNNDHPSKAVITGSVTPDFIGAIEIVTLELGNASSGEEYLTPIWTIPTPVKYLRFTPIENVSSDADREYKTFWHAADINLYQPEATAVVDQMIADALGKYDEYLWGEDVFNLGTEPGQYSNKEAADEFLRILTDLNNLQSGIQEGTANRPSQEEVVALVNALNENFDAYKASQNNYVFREDGYYRIIANLDYKETVETGEVDEFEEPITHTTYVKKTMYSMLEGFGAWHTYDANDCRDIWHITKNEDGTVNMINAATGMGFWTFGSPVTMSAEPDSIKVIQMDWAGFENEHEIVYLRPEPYNPSDGKYFHQLSHGRGTGKGDKLCTWNPTFNMGEPYDSDKGTSEWYLERVDDEEAQTLIAEYAMVKDHDLLVIEYKKILANAQDGLAVANEAFSKEFITRNDQFSSPVTESAEGSLSNLLDDNWDTFWHSSWKGGARPGGTHFIDVTFDDPIEGDIYVWVQRRNSENDHPITWGIYGSNDEASLEQVADFDNTPEDTWLAATTAGWELIADSVSTPWVKGQKEVTMPTFNVPQPYKYMRFVCEESMGPSYGTRGYFHLGGFQVYKTLGKAQIETMGAVGEAFAAAVEKGANLEDADITLADYNELEDAYNAFIALLKDPRPMRAAVKKYMAETGKLEIGETPGYWPTDAEAKALEAILAEANAYDQAANYEQEKLDAYTAAIESAVEAFWAAPIKIEANKWYRFRFPTEETYEKYGWSDGNIRQSEGFNIGDLFGQYVAVAKYYSTGEYEGNPMIEVKETENMREGDWLEFTAEDNINNPDAALFRFISIGDTAYIIQNKATGLYINAAGANSNYVTMSLEPTTFKWRAAGCGGNLLAGKSLSGTNVTYLHAQRANHRLVTWNASDPSTNSSLWIEPTDEEGDATNEFIREYTPGVITANCVASGIKLAEEGDLALYTVAGTFTKDETAYVALNTITETEPGVPFIAIVGTPDDFQENGAAEPFAFTQTYAGFAAEAGSVNGLVGIYATDAAPIGAVVFVDNTAATAEDKVIEEEDGTFTGWTNRTVAANGAYLEFGKQVVDSEGAYDLVIAIDGEPNDVAVRNVLDNVAKAGAIYSMDGKLMRKSGNINDVKALGKGIYILNGAKIYVK